MYTPKQIKNLLEIIDRVHIMFIGKNIGLSELTSSEKSILKNYGIDLSTMSKFGAADTAFKFGLLVDGLKNSGKENISYKEIKKFLENDGFIPYTNSEKLAIEHVKQRMSDEVRGLASRIKNDISNSNSQRAKAKIARYREKIDSSIEEAVRKNSSVTELANSIQSKLKKWTTDFDRVADYSLHEAFDMGQALSIQDKYGNSAKVYKEVYAGACESCQKLYLTKGIGSKPKIFELSAIMANGTNIGRNKQEWLPVVGSTHPWCRCTIFHIPFGYVWDDNKGSFEPVRDKKIERKSRVKIIIDKDY